MKNLLAILIVFLLAFNITTAKKKDVAGSVENGVYTDDSYNFKLAIPDDWNYSIKKSKDNVRLNISKKQFDIPIQFQNAPNYTTGPKITVYVDTTSLSVDQFVDSLLSEKFKSKQKSKILPEFKILNGPQPFVVKKRATLSVGELSGVKVAGQQRYTLEVQRSGSSSDQADVVSDFYGGSIFFAKEGKMLVMMHLICEWRYFDVTEQQFLKIINGFQIVK